MNRIIIIAAALGAVASANAAQLAVFDSMTLQSGQNYIIPATNHHLMGQAFNLGNTGAGSVSINGMDTVLVSTAAVAYTNITLEVTFFNNYNVGGTAASNAFSNALATYTFSFGAFNAGLNNSYTIGTNDPNTPGLAFSTPFSFSGSTNLGVQMMWKGDTGTGLQITNNLTTAIRGGTGYLPFTVGSGASGAAPSFGYFRNASIANPTSSANSLLISDGRQIGDNSGLALRLYSADAVPEPATMTILGFGIAALAAKKKKKN